MTTLIPDAGLDAIRTTPLLRAIGKPHHLLRDVPRIVTVDLPNATTLYDVEVVLPGRLRGEKAVLVRWREAGKWRWRWVLEEWVR